MTSDDDSPFPADAFRKQDEAPDTEFYAYPRLVNHIDDFAIAAVGEAYRRFLPEGGDFLDLMSSHVSHFPKGMKLGKVAGHGMNAIELSNNPVLSERLVKDLNAEPVLPYEDNRFDGVVICVSVQYLTQPVAVFSEIGRVLKPGAPLVVAFSNRCFPTKAIEAWRLLDDPGHAQLVGMYALESGRFEDPTAYDFSPRIMVDDALEGRGTPAPWIDELLPANDMARRRRIASGEEYSDPLFVVVAVKKKD
jgi:SAM-dependent methyltransferase